MIDVISLEYMQKARLQEFDAEAEKAFQAKVARRGDRFAPILLPATVVARRARQPLSGNLMAKAAYHN